MGKLGSMKGGCIPPNGIIPLSESPMTVQSDGTVGIMLLHKLIYSEVHNTSQAVFRVLVHAGGGV